MAESVGLIPVLTPQELTAKKQAQAAMNVLEAPKAEEIKLNLAGHVRNCWQEAKRAKIDVEAQMLKNMRQIDGKYESDMLAAIRDAEAPEYFMMLTDAKCRAAEAWVKEVVCQPGYKPWDLEPTPEPDLPQEVLAAIRQQFISRMFSALAATIAQNNQIIDPFALLAGIRQLIPKFDEQVRKLATQESKERAEKIKVKVDDHLTEGRWYQAIEEFISDVIRLKAGVIKGPILRKEPTIVIKPTANGKHEIRVEEKLVWRYERRSPFNIFPQPKSTGPQHGYLIDLITLEPKDLVALKGVDGFNKKEINAVLEEYRAGGLREWTNFAAEKQAIEKKPGDALYKSDDIDCLEFWGPIQGKLLKEWGLNSSMVKDELAEYQACVWLIGTHVIKAMLNPDPMGMKPFNRLSYEEVADSFWGKGLPELIVDIQRACNACVRAIMHNIGVASGPQVEVDIDRLAPGESTKLIPWRVWRSTNDQMQTGKAVNFYAPPIIVERLIAVYKFFSNLADEYCGIPAYAHGDPQVGGAGNTASGLSMLITQAARGIKGLIKALDSRVIVPNVTAAYHKVIVDEDSYGVIPDHKIVAQGATALLAKEQLAIRRTEFMAQTNNPVDVQIMGPKGRKYLLKTTARALDLEEDKVVPEDEMQNLLAAAPMASLASPETLGPDGMPNSVGQDFRAFNPGA